MPRPFPVKFKENYPSYPCIYKAYFGTKFIIMKAKALKQSVTAMMENIDRRIRLGYKDDDPQINVYKHIKKARVVTAIVEVLFHSENHGELMAFESDVLRKYEGNPLCLNTTFIPYQPAWISQKQVDEFVPGLKTFRFEKPETTEVSTSTPEIVIEEVAKLPVEPKLSPQIDLNDLDDILDALDKVNATKDIKARN
jgi:hypothetical protein